MPRRRGIFTLAVCALGALPCSAKAQTGFLFAEPRTSVSLRTGWAAARAGSDLFAFTTDQLTLNRGDFSSLAVGADVGFRVLPRTRLVLSVDFAGTSKLSEFREFVDNNELPIEQTTWFARVPITMGVKQYLTSTGRSIGRLAWIPSRIAPYAGVGGGMMYYRFRQSGDFIDFETMDVFASQFVSSGWTPTAHALAGFDYSLGARFALTAEARYQWSRAPLSSDFSGFQRLDLSGLATTAGLSVRF